MTRYEKIKAMTIEEMAEFMNDVDCSYCAIRYKGKCNGNHCIDGRKQWLEQEADDEAE